MLLAGDIGGTKTILAIYSTESGPHAPLAEATYPSAEYPSLETLASKFLAQVNLKVERASFGVAGPVVGGRATVTNLPWVLDEAQLRRALDVSAVHLLNDVLAVAHAVPGLGAADVRTLNQGSPAHGGAIAVIAPGTGLGEAYLTWDGARYRAFASEGGHTDFGPNTLLEMEMLRFLQQRFDHVSYERICSGIGLPNIYRFLKESGYASEPAWLAERLAVDDPTPIIVAAALDTSRPCELCAVTLDLFVSALGAEAGNMALKVLAMGGVYLGGGIPPRILPLLTGGKFMQAFLRKGRFSELLSRMSVRVILNSKAALLGAALYGLDASRDG